MGKKPSVVQINGKHYDVITGQQMGKPGPFIDGFRRPTHLAPTIKKAVSPVKPHLSTAKKHLIKPAQTVHQRTQRSKTLMRGIVAKPATPKRRQKPASGLKAQSGIVSPARFSKAMGVAKSHSVKRFGNPLKSSSTPYNHNSINRDVVSAKAPSGTSAVAIQPMPSVITNVSHQRLERMLDEALIKADAHKQALRGRIRSKNGFLAPIRRLPKWVVVTTVVVVTTIAAAFFAWNNIPQLSMKVASMRGEVKGSVPAYIPAGFKFAGPIKNEAGTLKMTYKDAAGSGGSYTITEQPSNWDSSSLAANTSSPDTQVQTSQVKGTTVFYDGANNASWVTGGLKYKIVNGANLNADDLNKIAGSLGH